MLVKALIFEFVVIQEKIHERRAAKLKEDVKRISVEANGLLVKLEMIDDIMKLGLESLFGKEIKEGLYSMALLINHNNQVFAMTSMLPHYALGYLDKLSSLTRYNLTLNASAFCFPRLYGVIDIKSILQI